MLPVARLSDFHVCPMVNGLVPHVGGPILPICAIRVLSGGLPTARIGDLALCVGPPDVIVTGSPKVLVMGKPVARITDKTVHGGMIVAGLPRVLIGGGTIAQVQAPTVGNAMYQGLKEWAIRKLTKELDPPKKTKNEKRVITAGARAGLAGKIQEGKASANPEKRKAAERLEKNVKALEMAKLADNVYNFAKDSNAAAPPGWKNISNDPEALDKYGLKPENLRSDSGFQAAVYLPDPATFGPDAKPVVAFKGTTSWNDWKQNFRQGMDLDSDYYGRAVEIGRLIEQSGQQVEMSGHSLGGGLASAAALAADMPATTFNAAGLHSNTVPRYLNNPDFQTDPSKIQAYRVENEVLTGLQEQGLKGTAAAAAVGGIFGGPIGASIGAIARTALAAKMPHAIGSPHTLPGSGSPLARHGMDQVVAGVESQIGDDVNVLEGF